MSKELTGEKKIVIEITNLGLGMDFKDRMGASLKNGKGEILDHGSYTEEQLCEQMIIWLQDANQEAEGNYNNKVIHDVDEPPTYIRF